MNLFSQYYEYLFPSVFILLGIGIVLIFLRKLFVIPFLRNIWAKRRKSNEWGYVYVISNKYMPGIVKVGFTSRDVKTRIRELYTTGVPESFHVEWVLKTNHAERVELQAHRLMNKYRVNRYREFFSLPPEKAKKFILTARKHVLSSKTDDMIS